MIKIIGIFLSALLAVATALNAQTGVAVAELESLDREIPALMAAAHVPGGAVAIVKEGRLVFARGYGMADISSGEPFQPDSLCRVGSVSKTITAAAILKLVESGRLNLDANVFPEILNQLAPAPGASPDRRLNDISVRHLLHHTGGHGRDTGIDPLNIGSAVAAAQIFHTTIPPGYDNTVRYAMGLPLDCNPGSKYSYSNYGFTVLARVIERVTTRPYEDAVRDLVLRPLGLSRMAVGQTLPEGRRSGEVRYYDVPRAPLYLSFFTGMHRLLPLPYANFELEAGDGSGRWIASAVDLARFVSRVEGSRTPAFLAPETLSLLYERPDPFVSQDPTGDSWYGLGTGVFRNGSFTGWTHGGFYYGALSGYLSFGDGYIFTFVFNATPDNDSFQQDIYSLLEALDLNQKNWPSHDLFSHYFPED
jgi:CubicO group peptidase (beta-lactamase class C family)